MGAHGDDDTSFNPKTWLSSSDPEPPADKTPPPATKNTSGDEPSFDLRSWGNSAEPAPPPPPAPAPPPPPSAAPPPPADPGAATRKTRLLLASGSCAVLLAVGAGVAFVARPGVIGSKTVQAADAAVANATGPVDPEAVATTGPAVPSRRTLVVGSAAEIVDALKAAGVMPRDIESIRKASVVFGDTAGEIKLAFDIQGPDGNAQLLNFEATRADGSGVTLTRGADGNFGSKAISADLETKIKVVRGELDGTSFYTSAVTAGVTDSLIGDFANAFSFDFDMQREVAPGDIFEAAFEQAYNPSGEAVGVPKLLYVSLQTAAKSRALYRFLAPGEKEPKWYDGNGKSTQRALMRTPVDAARISSGFGWRVHPVLGYMKLHKGTDFAAPIGTPIYASGDGVVVWAAMKGPNGNLTKIQHDNGWMTLYLHQKLFMPGIVPGARVHQGEKIGEIGLTGRTTGPHLHYEVHINGEPVNPLEIDMSAGGGVQKGLEGPALAAFVKERNRIDKSRASAAN
ncbi:M23 family metallopeptidase [Sphingomonas immobilis]|uniref:Peptidoglycan DD-metalloendopeptidase family protein n=1 Tax=Sphingomonas immobilis TaxID=3063997 RepID=A0ABT9A3M4_9SPHN|nr:peptidoglycan DD-metalloendopeptidase family protein [Sphingomonas sp. CA1-15]MDO7843815.1 peptidoglycan DD-metalloendopeptidase family protein [Sphingomonas sp. CA1-15]